MRDIKSTIRKVLHEQLYDAPGVVQTRKKIEQKRNADLVKPKWFDIDDDFIDVFGRDVVFQEYRNMGYDIDEENLRYGISWVSPIEKRYMVAPTGDKKFGADRDGRSHDGVDYAAPIGTDVLAVKNGSVVGAGDLGKNCGNGVKLKLENDYSVVYCHLSSVDVTSGESVRAGEKIGEVGTTGVSSGSHLHIKISDPSGNPIDNWSLIYSKLT